MFTDDLAGLVKKWAPILYFHPKEENLPSSADWFAQRAAYVPAEGARLSPGSWTWSSVKPTADDYLQGSPLANGGDLGSAVAYVHALPVIGQPALVDLQYWFFYPYNGATATRVENFLNTASTSPLDLAEHPGDWERICVRVSSSGIVAVYMAQHGGGAWLTAAPSDDPDAGYHLEHGRPVVYVALGSHAAYPNQPGPYQYAGIDLLILDVQLIDQTGNGTRFDTAGHLQIVANDCSQFTYKPIPPAWLSFPGRWGQPAANPITPQTAFNWFFDALKVSYTGVGWVLYAIGLILGSAFVAVAGIGGLLFAVIWRWELEGPRTPTSQDGWSRSDLFLPWGKDQQTANDHSWNTTYDTAFLEAFGGLMHWHAQSPSQKPNIRVAQYTGGRWVDPGLTPPIVTDGPVAGARYDTAGSLALVVLRAGSLACWQLDAAGNGAWQQSTTFPNPAATSGAGIGKLGQKWYVFWRGTDAGLWWTSTPDWQQWTAPASVPTIQLAPGAARAHNSPAVATIATYLVVAYLAPPEPNEQAQVVSLVTADAQSWSGPFPVAEAQSTLAPALVAVGDGIFCLYTDSKQQVRCSASPDGQSWCDPAAVSSARTKDTPTAVASGGQLYAVHTGRTNSRLYWTSAPVQAAQVAVDALRAANPSVPPRLAAPQ